MPGPDRSAVLAVDQGTSATKAILVDAEGAITAAGSVPLRQSHPRPGLAEQDALEIWSSVQAAVLDCLEGQDASAVVAVGLSTQRESALLWDRNTLEPLGPVLGWQDARGAALCGELRAAGHGERVRAISGLPLDPMFSASKATWLLDEYDPDRSRSMRGELCFGTVDAWLLARLGGGHVIEAGNASRTQLLDLSTCTWDPFLLDLFRVPSEVLPAVVPSIGALATAAALPALTSAVPITGVLGDSHAALFAHGAWRPGEVKATYGTGSSVMGVTTREAVGSAGLCRTIGWDIDRPTYAVEGNIRSSGATLVWLAELFEIDLPELARIAADDSDGVHLVPAFTGLGAPWWDDQAVAITSGLSFGTRRGHLARAAFESIAFQVEDVIVEVEREVGPVPTVLVDGGPTANPLLMQLQADTSGRTVARARARDLSALGAAHMAGLGVGLWSLDALEALPRQRESVTPTTDAATRNTRRAGWHAALARSRRSAVDARPNNKEHEVHVNLSERHAGR